MFSVSSNFENLSERIGLRSPSAVEVVEACEERRILLPDDEIRNREDYDCAVPLRSYETIQGARWKSMSRDAFILGRFGVANIR